MKYQITGYIKDDKSFGLDECCKYTSEIVPHIDEYIYLPHKGLYQVIQVIYHTSNDGYDYDNKIMFVELILRPHTLFYY